MSTENIINKHNLSTNKAISEFITSVGLDIIKRRRFDVGKRFSKKLYKDTLRLEKYTCEKYCDLENDESRQTLREKVIRKTINRITEI